MRRRVTHDEGETVSLFPFLAVLICTMGALIMVLVVMVQQGRRLAAADSDPTANRLSAEKIQQLQQEREDHVWRLAMLESSHQQGLEKLAESRQMLSHLEDHARRLADQLRGMRDSRHGPNELESGDARVLEQQLQAIEQQIEQQTMALQQQQEQSTHRKQLYALIPYEGAHGTRRRPIYIECLSDRVVIHPEKLVLNEDDLDPSLGPDNSLAMVLRAMREYMHQSPTVTDTGDPYPLLVVRPQGIDAYAAARAAMKSWDAEFGYELLNDEVRLAYPPPDPKLAEILERVLAEARQTRQRQQALMQTVSRSNGGTVYRTTGPRGGFVADSTTDNDDRIGGTTTSGNSAGESRTPFHAASARKKSPATGAMEEHDRSPVGDATSNATANQTSGRDASTSASHDDQPTPRDGKAGDRGARSSRAKSLAREKGRNWALPDSDVQSMGITRPIVLKLEPNRLVIKPEGREQAPVVLNCSDATISVVEPLVKELWKRIDRWGNAGPGVYWKPILQVDVAPGAEARWEDLSVLLQDSGLEIVREARETRR